MKLLRTPIALITVAAALIIVIGVAGGQVRAATLQVATVSNSAEYTCDTLEVAAQEHQVAKITKLAITATNGATLKNVMVDWGDNSPILTTTNAVGQTHKYAEAKTYTVVATAAFMVEGQDVLSNSQCQQSVTLSPDKLPVVTAPADTPPSAAPPARVTPKPAPVAVKPAPIKPTPPVSPITAPTAQTDLTNTGPGDVVAWFVAATLVGILVHHNLLARRLSAES